MVENEFCHYSPKMHEQLAALVGESILE